MNDWSDHMVDALRYAFISVRKPIVWYKRLFFNIRRFFRACRKAIVAFFKEVLSN